MSLMVLATNFPKLLRVLVDSRDNWGELLDKFQVLLINSKSFVGNFIHSKKPLPIVSMELMLL